MFGLYPKLILTPPPGVPAAEFVHNGGSVAFGVVDDEVGTEGFGFDDAGTGMGFEP